MSIPPVRANRDQPSRQGEGDQRRAPSRTDARSDPKSRSVASDPRGDSRRGASGGRPEQNGSSKQEEWAVDESASASRPHVVRLLSTRAAHEVVFTVLQLYGLSTLAPVRSEPRCDLADGELTGHLAVAVGGRRGRQLL